MVYIRKKKVKGIDYVYLVRSFWNKNTNTSRQETIKYLGKISTITINDIPLEYQNDPKILAFLSSFVSNLGFSKFPSSFFFTYTGSNF